jgi:hypothetical protein
MMVGVEEVEMRVVVGVRRYGVEVVGKEEEETEV